MNYLYPRIQYLDYHIISLLNERLLLHEPFAPNGFWSFAEYVDDHFFNIVYHFDREL